MPGLLVNIAMAYRPQSVLPFCRATLINLILIMLHDDLRYLAIIVCVYKLGACRKESSSSTSPLLQPMIEIRTQ